MRQQVSRSWLVAVCESVRVFAFSDDCVEVPPRTGMALRDAIHTATRMGSTQLGAAVTKVNDLSHDRLIVVTDEQSADRVPKPKGLGYMINVASNRNGVGYGKWLHVDGWSDAVVRFITEHERTDTQASKATKPPWRSPMDRHGALDLLWRSTNSGAQVS